ARRPRPPTGSARRKPAAVAPRRGASPARTDAKYTDATGGRGDVFRVARAGWASLYVADRGHAAPGAGRFGAVSRLRRLVQPWATVDGPMARSTPRRCPRRLRLPGAGDQHGDILERRTAPRDRSD